VSPVRLPQWGAATFLRHEQSGSYGVRLMCRCEETGRTFTDPVPHPRKNRPRWVYCRHCLAEHSLI
jgi:hypothetical protein